MYPNTPKIVKYTLTSLNIIAKCPVRYILKMYPNIPRIVK